MKNTLIISALLALTPVAFCQEVEAGEAVILELIADAQKLAVLLEGVTDKESADNAAFEILPIRRKMEETGKSLQNINRDVLMKHLGTLMAVTEQSKPILEKLVQENFYNSDALRNVMMVSVNQEN